MFTVEVASNSVPGRLRRNDDRFLVDQGSRLFAVADGDTGSGDGGLAAEHALMLLDTGFEGNLGEAVAYVQDEMARLKEKGSTLGETTLTALHISDGDAEVANVGDSPCYLVRDSELHLLSSIDRTPSGAMSQTIGMADGIQVHKASLPLRDGDVFVLGSHGVAQVLRHNVVVPMARASLMEPGRVVAEIIRRAETTEGRSDDDKTVIVIRLTEEESGTLIMPGSSHRSDE